jgi:hypothetical protein
MAVGHPDFPHVSVVGLPNAEAPKRGAFFATRKGDTLSSIAASLVKTGQWPEASSAGTVIGAINNSSWNRSNCYYRTDSSNCASKRVTSGGYIALCQSDGNASAKILGSKFPVIWIPSKDFANPSDVPLPKVPVKDTAKDPDVIVNPMAPAKKSSGIAIWIGIAIAVVAVGGIFYTTTQLGGKRK